MALFLRCVAATAARRWAYGGSRRRAGCPRSVCNFGRRTRPLDHKKLLWVYRKFALKEEAAPKIHAPEYVSGEAFCYLGRRFSLKVVRSRTSHSNSMARDSSPPRCPPGGVPFPALVPGDRHGMASPRVELAPRNDTTRKPEKIEVRDLGFRWGSCGKGAVVYFNWKVLQLPCPAGGLHHHARTCPLG